MMHVRERTNGRAHTGRRACVCVCVCVFSAALESACLFRCLLPACACYHSRRGGATNKDEANDGACHSWCVVLYHTHNTRPVLPPPAPRLPPRSFAKKTAARFAWQPNQPQPGHARTVAHRHSPHGGRDEDEPQRQHQEHEVARERCRGHLGRLDVHNAADDESHGGDGCQAKSTKNKKKSERKKKRHAYYWNTSKYILRSTLYVSDETHTHTRSSTTSCGSVHRTIGGRGGSCG